MALSLLEEGAEKKFDENYLHAPITKQLIFNRHFFDKLVKKIAACRRLTPGPMSDGREYNAEEALKHRLEKLAVTPHSSYLNVGIDNQVTWPKQETLVHFDRYTMILLPKTKEHVRSVSIDLHGNGLSIKDARTVINRFLSLMTWCDDQFAVAQDGWAGNPVPCPVPHRNLAFSTAHLWVFDRKMPMDMHVQRALALYREARNAEQNYLVSYAVLNYYKVIEIKHPQGPQTRTWLAAAFPVVEPNIPPKVLQIFHSERGSKSTEAHIYDAYRLAVAHASSKTPSDPDCSAEISRLHNAAAILRKLARHFIAMELNVSDCIYSGD